MGRRPCCAKEGLNRGAWSAREDQMLTNYVNIHGVGKWRDLPQKAGLRRCGKSCRLRWLNYLRPDIKRGNITKAEEELILRLHRLLGNRWSLIAGRLPGRTDNEIKNYWNTILGKKFQCKTTQKDLNKSKDKKPEEVKEDTHPVIRTKAVRCTKVYLPQEENQLDKKTMEVSLDGKSPFSLTQPLDDSSNFLMDFNIGENFVADALNSDFLQPFGDGVQGTDNATGGDDAGYNSYSFSNYPFTTNEMLEDSTNGAVLENFRGCDPPDQRNSALDLKTLSSFLES